MWNIKIFTKRKKKNEANSYRDVQHIPREINLCSAYAARDVTPLLPFNKKEKEWRNDRTGEREKERER